MAHADLMDLICRALVAYDAHIEMHGSQPADMDKLLAQYGYTTMATRASVGDKTVSIIKKIERE